LALVGVITAHSGPALAVNQVRFCVSLTNQFTDNLPNQDKLTADFLQADKHWAVVKRNGVDVAPAAYMVGNCTPFTTINPGSYTLSVTSAVRVGTNKYVFAHADDDEQWSWYNLTISVAANPTGDTTIPVTFLGADEFAASVIAAGMPASSLIPHTYKVYAHQECPDNPGYSCNVFGEASYIAPNAADLKSVIAHELGHEVSNQLYGGWAYNYSFTVSQVLCRCDHVPAGTQSHCMNSREQNGAARNEGFSHFYASILFNNATHTTAPFAYYKEVLEPPGVIPNNVVPPPYPFDALLNYKWVENRCLASDRNGEMDWMGFMYFLYTRGGAQSFAFPEMESVFEAAAGTTWFQLVSAAESIYGIGTPKVQHLVTAGDTRGVDH
jgi:hypothetical protein